MATQLITGIKEKNAKNNALIVTLKYYIDLLKAYQVDSINTIKKIGNDTEKNPELAEEFKDIVKGLEGEFTRATSIEMGKQKLLSHLEKAIDNLAKDYVSIQEYVIKPQEDLKTMFDSIDANISIDSVVGRKLRYNRTNLERDFMYKKLIGVLGTKISNLHASLTPKQLLLEIREIIAIIRIFEFDNINTSINLYHNKCALIANNFKVIGKIGEFRPELNKIEHVLIDRSGDEEFNRLLTVANKVEEVSDDELTIFDTIVDELGSTLARLKQIIEQLGTVFTKLNVSPYNVADTYAPGIKEVLTQYSKTELTNEEFFKKLEDSLITLHNVNTVEVDILNVFSNALTNLNNYVYIFNYVYGLCEEATVKGTIIDGKINVGVGKK